MRLSWNNIRCNTRNLLYPSELRKTQQKSKINTITGFSNKNNLEFAKYLNNINIPVWIRQVLVPGYTDDKFDLQNLKKFIDNLNNVEKVEILPQILLNFFL